MTENDFIKELLIALESENQTGITKDSLLSDIEGYDSLGILAIIAMVDKNFGVKFHGQDFIGFRTVGDVINRIGEDKFAPA